MSSLPEEGPRSAADPEPVELKERDFKLLSGLIHQASGVRLGPDKRELLAARLRPLLRTMGVKTFAGLCAAVSTDDTGEKLALLVDRATTNTTGFFRHRPQLELLRERLPSLARARGKLRIWSAGCSSGEEPYSIALLLVADGRAKDAKVLATDVSRRALAKAKLATYDEDALETVPPELRSHFREIRATGGSATVSGDGRYELEADVRSLVHVRHHDLRSASQAARGVFDAVFCRNVLIYFDATERARAVARLAEVLRPGGLFFLGPSESGVELPPSFARIGTAAYEKRS